MIYHILTKSDWEAAKIAGEYYGHRFETTGFIHCSPLEKIVPVANFNFRGKQDMLLLELDPERISSEVKWEDLYNDEYDFPHIYGKMELGAVTRIFEFSTDHEGYFYLPDGLV